MKKTLLFLLLSATACSLFAQIQVLKNGHVIVRNKHIGEEFAQQRIVAGTAIVPDSTLAMTIDGTGSNNTGGAIAFGNKGEVAVGELRGNDNILQLKAEKGIVYTGALGQTIFEFTQPSPYSSYPFKFYMPLQAPKYVTDSDARLKSDIECMDGKWLLLSRISPVTYSLNPQVKRVSADNSDDNHSVLTDNVQNHSTDYGFIAQEVREVYPELVYENEEGYLALDYQGFIPILVEAVNSLRQTVEQQQKLISELTGDKKITPLENASKSQDQATLSQNKPNPFSGDTRIECHIPATAASAALCIYDLRGKQVKRVELRERGDVPVIIAANELEAGIYLYALIVDSEEIGPFRMIVNN